MLELGLTRVSRENDLEIGVLLDEFKRGCGGMAKVPTMATKSGFERLLGCKLLELFRFITRGPQGSLLVLVLETAQTEHRSARLGTEFYG